MNSLAKKGTGYWIEDKYPPKVYPPRSAPRRPRSFEKVNVVSLKPGCGEKPNNFRFGFWFCPVITINIKNWKLQDILSMVCCLHKLSLHLSLLLFDDNISHTLLIAFTISTTPRMFLAVRRSITDYPSLINYRTVICNPANKIYYTINKKYFHGQELFQVTTE